MPKFEIGPLYPITDSKNRRQWSHVRLARGFLSGGARFFQVREKALSDGEFFRQLRQIAGECGRAGGRFVVNDRVDLALAAEATGVHLGQDDLPVAEARKLLGRDAVIGLSTHNLKQFEAALELPVDYIAVGPIFATATKPGANAPLGCGFIERVRKLTRLPLVAIGGVTLERAGQVWDAGADSVAVISDIVNQDDPARRVREYMERSKR